MDLYLPLYVSVSDISAVGVIYHDSTGKSHLVGVDKKGEVILIAGTLGSTHSTCVSGVGPRPYLSSLSIPVVHHQPFVGQFLSDNPRNSISLVPPFPLPNVGACVVGITKNGSYIFSISGVVPFFSPVSPIFFPYPYSPLNLSVATIISKISRPLSTGSLRLVSPRNVTVGPIVRFNYFANPIDLSQRVNAVRYIGKMTSIPTMDQYKFQDQEW